MSKAVWIIGITCALLVTFGVVLFASYKPIVSLKVTQEVFLANGSEAYDKWKHPPISIFLNVWIFNITNADKFLADRSSNITVEEIGPYVYEEFKEKVIFKETQDELTYVPKSIFKFRPDLSGARSADDKFTTLNIPLLTMLGLDATSQNMGEEKFKFLSSIIKGYINPKNADRYSESLPVVTKSVHELVLGGYLPEIFNKTKAAAKSAGLHMPMNFSILLERNNNTQMPGNWTIKTGVNDPSKMATLIAWNNKTYNPTWQSNTSCSELRGTDGQQFPTGVSESTLIDIFVPDLCREITFVHSGSGSIGGIDGLRFDLRQIYDSSKESDTCYCMKSNTSECFKKGLMDIAKCRYDSPIVVSQPHFLNVDDELIVNSAPNNVTPPDSSAHSSHLYVEPWTGVPLSVSVKLQINFDLKSFPIYNWNHTRQVVPLLWFEQSANVNDESVRQLNSLLFDKIKILQGVSATAIALAVIIALAMVVKRYRERRNFV